jgi:wobble nucleotide-excising tRNase
MITAIRMNGVASYKQPVEILDLKKFNLFYGLNGTGKTTLTEFLANHEKNLKKFAQCSLITTSPQVPEIHVYNQSFIEENFHETERQKGIFSLDKTNTVALAAITEARSTREKLEVRKQSFLDRALQLTQDEETAKNNLTESVWEDKKVYERTILKDCMKGFLKPQSAFTNKILESESNASELETIPVEFEKLRTELEELSSSNVQKKNLHPVLAGNLEIYENASILAEQIVGSKDSYLSELIAKLNHADWVSEGITEYIDRTDDCPFCKRSMDGDLKQKIKAHIDTTYQEKRDALDRLKRAYTENRDILQTKIDHYKTDSVLSQNTDLTVLIQRLENTLRENMGLIEKKLKEPSLPVTLNSTLVTIQTIDQIISNENSQIENFNKKIDNRTQAIADIKTKFWQLLRKKYDSEIAAFLQGSLQRQKQIAEAKTEANREQEKINAQNAVILRNQAQTKNVDTAVNRINTRLESFGLEGFKIQKIEAMQEQNAHFYKIAHNDQEATENTFKKLSEGEKTLISFLYFVEICLGVDDADKDGHAGNRIIVIDDPISSLSFNVVFDIATLIKDLFLTPDTEYQQVMILTHHLYFLHELNWANRLKGDQIRYFRVTKYRHTRIADLEIKDIKNNYQCYWQIIKDVKEGKLSSIMLPNAIRNILEHYFSFIRRRDAFSKIINDMAARDNDPALKAFDRYVNKSSHSDAVNLTDVQEIDPMKFIQYFRSVFDKTGFPEHYQEMMDEEVPANENLQITPKTGTE